MSLRLVLGRLKKYKLGEYNHNEPIIFVSCSDPDEACHKAYMGLHNKITSKALKNTDLINQTTILHFSKEILEDVRVLHVGLANEEGL